jgi:O-antigen ligase
VILTEVDPQQAMRAVFVRCAYVLIPLSLIFIRYFPNLGRSYNIHSGAIEPVGVTFQKNSLGTMVMVCGLVLIWDWIERTRPGSARLKWIERCLPIVILSIGAYLLHLCDSKSSIACLVLGSCILGATRLPLLRNRIAVLGRFAVAAVLIFFLLDSLFGIKEGMVEGMGRDMTFTGRTELWHDLLATRTDPVVGVGFCSFWSDEYYQTKLPEELSGGRSAHNGYLEMYIDGGWVGIFFLVIMLMAIGLRINRQLGFGDHYSVLRFAVYVMMLIGNISESHIGRMSELGFLFLLVAMEPMINEVDYVATKGASQMHELPNPPLMA